MLRMEKNIPGKFNAHFSGKGRQLLRYHIMKIPKATQIKLIVSQARPHRIFHPAWGFFFKGLVYILSGKDHHSHM